MSKKNKNKKINIHWYKKQIKSTKISFYTRKNNLACKILRGKVKIRLYLEKQLLLTNTRINICIFFHQPTRSLILKEIAGKEKT